MEVLLERDWCGVQRLISSQDFLVRGFRALGACFESIGWIFSSTSSSNVSAVIVSSFCSLRAALREFYKYLLMTLMSLEFWSRFRYSFLDSTMQSISPCDMSFSIKASRLSSAVAAHWYRIRVTEVLYKFATKIRKSFPNCSWCTTVAARKPWFSLRLLKRSFRMRLLFFLYLMIQVWDSGLRIIGVLF